MNTPYIGFGNDTLAQQPIVHAGDWVECNNCPDAHRLRAADDGSELLLFFKCGDTPFLGAVNNRLVVGVKADVSGSI